MPAKFQPACNAGCLGGINRIRFALFLEIRWRVYGPRKGQKIRPQQRPSIETQNWYLGVLFHAVAEGGRSMAQAWSPCTGCDRIKGAYRCCIFIDRQGGNGATCCRPPFPAKQNGAVGVEINIEEIPLTRSQTIIFRENQRKSWQNWSNRFGKDHQI